MNGNSFESMIKKYADELIKMSREKMHPDNTEAAEDNREAEKKEESDVSPFEQEETPVENDLTPADNADFSEEAPEKLPTEQESALTDYATFSARIFTGNNAYPIENAKVLVVKDDRLYTFLTTDRDGVTKKIRLPAYPESNTLNPASDRQSVEYSGEVYVKGFTPKKGLLISAVGGSDIVLDVQMTPISEREF